MKHNYKLNEYAADADATAVYPGRGTPLGLVYCALGCAEEAAEVAGKVKKMLRDDGIVQENEDGSLRFGEITPERTKAIVKEMGDVLWYLSQLSHELRVPLSAVAAGNIEKLADRQARGSLQGEGDER